MRYSKIAQSHDRLSLRWDTTPKLKQKLLLNIADFCVAFESAFVKNAKKSVFLKCHSSVAMETIQDGRQNNKFQNPTPFFLITIFEF